MRLRRRVMIHVIVVMGLTMVVLATIIVSDLSRTQRRFRENRAKVAAGMLTSLIRQEAEDARIRRIFNSSDDVAVLPRRLDELALNMVESDLVFVVKITRDGDTVVLQPKSAGNRPVAFDFEDAAKIEEPVRLVAPRKAAGRACRQ